MAVAAIAALAGLAGASMAKKTQAPAPVQADQVDNSKVGTSNAKKYLLSQTPTSGYGSNSVNTAKSFLVNY